ncbi:hypothetical protein [Roseimaritima ulvae]|uniref:Uncharacterized protein n=1 Tax=Roseimaritima ulvae TaxID=980254 RepID=A0A5B9QGX4_9BACT|nr:hypothetical protein [Roseimaritima ulvae]QEG38298.1 hypothetical protein UC8_02540 [Roseimaritima ulvae]
MNYLTHATEHLDRPYFVAGLAIPDWLSVVNRKVRTRSAAAEPFTRDADPRVRELACGIIRHHEDDRWFHQTRTFVELNLQFAVEIRDQLAGDAGFRPSFLGHILIELLLDADLIAEDRSRADRYYAALQQVSGGLVQDVVNRIATVPTEHLSAFLPRFIAERFLYDYVDNQRLLLRLNQVMRRVGLPILPDSLIPWLETARHRVSAARKPLLSPQQNVSQLSFIENPKTLT